MPPSNVAKWGPLLLFVAIFVATAISGHVIGADQVMPGPMIRHRDAIAAAVQYVAYGDWKGFAVYQDLIWKLNNLGFAILPEYGAKIGVGPYLEVLRSPALVNSAINTIAHLPQPSSGDLAFIARDDKGLILYYIASFTIFGYNVAGFFYSYMLIFGLALTTFVLTFRDQPSALIIAFSFCCVQLIIMLVIQGLPYDVHVIHGNRFIDVVTILSATHLLLLMCQRVPMGSGACLGALIQILLIGFMVLIRSSALWQTLPISALALLSAGVWAWTRRIGRSGPVRPLIWPAVLMVAGLGTIQVLEYRILNEAYHGDRDLSTHVVWHNFLTAIHNNPQRSALFDIPNFVCWDDMVSYFLFEKEITARGEDISRYVLNSPDWPLRTTDPRYDYNWKKYDNILKDVVIRTAEDHPEYVLSSLLYYQPIEIFNNIFSDTFLRYDILINPIMLLSMLAMTFLCRELRGPPNVWLLVGATLMIGASLAPALAAAVVSFRVVDAAVVIFSTGLSVGLAAIAWLLGHLVPLGAAPKVVTEE